MDIPKDALTVQHTGTNVTVGSPHLFHALARKLPGVSTQAQAEKIANDVMGVIREYKTLHAVARSFWHENGTEEMCIFIKGLVTTTFKFQSYQTPIKLVISNRYPQDAPQFYVDLEVATNMIVASNHPCIDRNGKVNHPHIGMWADAHRHGLSPFIRTLIEQFNEHPPLRAKGPSQLASTQAPVRPPASNPYVGASVPPNPAWSSASVAPTPTYHGGSYPMAMAAPPRIPPPAQSLQSPFATTPPPAMHWEYKFDPTSQRPYYFNAATNKSLWDPPPGAVVIGMPAAPAPSVRVQDPAEIERLEMERVKEEIVFNILSDNVREIAKEADNSTKALSATLSELQALRAESQTLQNHCTSYKSHTEQVVKFEQDWMQMLPQLERDHKSLDTLVLPPSGSILLQKLSEEQADAACSKALAVQGHIMQLHDSKKLTLDQYLRCVGSFAQRKFKAKYILRRIREVELSAPHVNM